MLDNSDIFDSTISFDPTHNHQQQQFLINHHENNFNHFPNSDHHLNHRRHSENQHFINMEISQLINDNNNQQQQQTLTMLNNNNVENINNCLTTTPPPPDLLNLFQLPKCSSSISFSNPTHLEQVMYDPAVLLPPQPPYFKDLLNSLPNGFNLTGCGSIFGDMEMERSGDHHQVLFHEGGSDHTVLEFGSGKGIRDNMNNNKDIKHPATEKQRRQQLKGKYDALQSLVPSPSKNDRASVVGDAINYINELKRTVEELKILVERKRCSRGRMKKHKTEDDTTLDVESIYTRSNGAGNGNGNGNGGGAGDASHDQQAYNGNSTSTMRTSWLQRKSKNTEIDVRIIDDEVTIKLVQQKRINCLLLVSKVLDELQLDLHHVAGGLIGDFYSYLFNTKICEGSSVYASAIANKLIEVVDKQYATIPVTSSY